MSDSVQGYCPMGCGKTLFLGSGGYVTCSWSRCPNPGAAADLLAIAEHEHIVVIVADGKTWSIEHPLRDRLEGIALSECWLHGFMSRLAGPPAMPGRYRVLGGPFTAATFLSIGESS